MTGLSGNSVDSRAETVFTTPMTTYKEATQIKPGDAIVFLGTPHVITEVQPPTESGARLGCYGYARSGEWSFSLYPGPVEVLAVGESVPPVCEFCTSDPCLHVSKRRARSQEVARDMVARGIAPAGNTGRAE